MSSKTQCLGKISHHNAPAPAYTISARRAKPTGRMALALALAVLGIWRPAWAEGPIQRYAIPAGSLEDALMEFVAQADLKLIFKTDLVRSARSAGLTGTLTPEQGVARLLEGSGIAYRFVDSNTVTIEPVAPVDPLERLVAEAGDMEYAQATEPAPKKPEAPVRKSEDGPTVLPEMTVTATPVDETGYNRPNATTATKTDTPIMETPVSIQVVPRAVIDDQKAATLKDVLQNVSGVRPRASIGVFNIFTIRGFTGGIYRNGLLTGFTDYDTANLERLEVLKGPAAILFGRIEPGGLINMVTKQPLAEPYYSLEQQFGSFDFYRTLWDATGAISSDRALQYRFTGAYQNSDSFRERHETEQFQIHTALTWHLSEATEIAVDVTGFNKDFQSNIGIPAIGDRPAPIPIERSLQDPNDPEDNLYEIFVGFNLTHRFNDAWTLQNRFLADFKRFDLLNNDPVFDNSALRPDNRTLDRTFFIQVSNNQSYHTNLDLTGKFDLWRTQHKVLLGFDYFRGDEEYFGFGSFDVDPSLAIDIFNPTARIDPARFDRQRILQEGVFDDNFAETREEQFGVYFQDQITLWDKLHILGGGRYDWASTGTGRSPSSFSEAEARRPERKDEAFSPRVGILYQPWSWLSLYGNWVQSFGANNGLSATGQAFDPQTGEQFEAGVKTALLDERLTATLAFYHLTKENILTPDLSTPDPFDSAAIGEARSQGIELDVSGQINDYLSLIGSYAFTDVEVTKDNSGFQGKRLVNVPDHAGSVWLKYDVNGTFVDQGWSFGLGGVAAGQREGDNENTFQLPGFARLDASAAYRLKLRDATLTAQLNVLNILDKRYFESVEPAFLNAAPRIAIFPGAPLTLIGSIRLEY